MNRILLIALVGVVLSPLCLLGDFSLVNNTLLHFASVEEGRKILTTKDDYIQRMSGFDRSARMKIDRLVSVDEFLAFVGKTTLDWTESEQQKVQEAVREIQSGLEDLHLPFPRTVNMIKTTGAEEGNAAYTRGDSIVLPKSDLTKDQKTLKKLICHELFHVLSRQNPVLRDKLYETIGFHRCEELNLPSQLSAYKITNPDAPRNDHFIRLKIESRDYLAIPILLSKKPTYQGGEFFDYLAFELLLVTINPGTGRVSLLSDNATPRLVSPQSVPNFLEQVGKNTEYIIHPEEILADNFALLVLGEQNVPSPEILRKMKGVFASAKP